MADRARTNLNRQFGLGLVLALLMTVGIWPVNVTTGNASPGRKGTIFDIIPDASNPTIPTSATSPAVGSIFVLTGRIYEFRSVNQATCLLNSNVDPVADQIGTWTATVVITPAITTTSSTTAASGDRRFQMHHTLVLDSLPGTIEVSGVNGLASLNGIARPADSNFPLGPTVGPAEVQTATGGSFRFEGLDGTATILPYCGPVPTSPLSASPPFRFNRAFCLAVNQSLQ
jgi:hypothetical protein